MHSDQGLDLALKRMGASQVDVLPVVSRVDVHKLEVMVATCWMRMECGRRKGVRLPGSSLGSELCGLSSVAFLSHLWGLLSAPLCTHGLLRGLHSFAASRLTAFPAFRSSKRNCAATQVAADLWVRVERQVWLLGALQHPGIGAGAADVQCQIATVAGGDGPVHGHFLRVPGHVSAALQVNIY